MSIYYPKANKITEVAQIKSLGLKNKNDRRTSIYKVFKKPSETTPLQFIKICNKHIPCYSSHELPPQQNLHEMYDATSRRL